MTHEDVQALASEYVLGVLDDVTRTRVATHLTSCPACAEELRQVAQTLDALGRSVPEVEPPASLRDRITAIPSRVPQISAVATVPAPIPAVVSRPASRPAPWFAAIAASLVAAVALWQAVGARAEIQRL